MTTSTRRVLLEKLSRLIRYHILETTTAAGSGHPTSSLSAVELMTALMFGGVFRYDLDRPDHPNNDRLIFSKGHASPLFYALWLAAGKLSPQAMQTYRRFGSPLEGHPTRRFPYTEAATGSLGQGLSIGLGMAMNGRYLDQLPYRTFVLLGDSEMAEGSQWEAIEAASYHGLDNLIGILDVNRLGQRGETMHGWDLEAYRRRLAAFGWETFLVDGHDHDEILSAYAQAIAVQGRPSMIVARTVKGKGVAAVEDRDGQHGKPLDVAACARAIAELGPVDLDLRGEVARPEPREPVRPARGPAAVAPPRYPADEPVATRVAYGNALARLYPSYPELVVLDGEVSNSTMAVTFKESYPERFFELFIAEQNLVGVAQGMATRGRLPFISTFAAFLTRAHDQIRMSQWSEANLKICGSHAGVAIGEDGPSQMGLEDLAMFRAMLDCVVLYPGDAWATEALVEAAAKHRGLVYLRTTRGKTPLLYGPDEPFPIGGSKVHGEGVGDVATVVAAGVTLHEALAAREELAAASIAVRVVDLYSVKPLDEATLRRCAEQTGTVITVEDHFPAGGIGEAVMAAVGPRAPVTSLAVRRRPCSGTPEELLDHEGISRHAIATAVRELTGR